MNRHRSSSLVGRVALGAALSALVAALLTALGTSLLAYYLLNQAENRRLIEAAVVLAQEIQDGRKEQKSLAQVIHDEAIETYHTGITFAVFQNGQGQAVAGDSRVPAVVHSGCLLSRGLRACGAPAVDGLWTVAASAQNRFSGWLALSAALAALLAALGAWLFSRPVAGWLIRPLLELRERVEFVNFHETSDLGRASGSVEVDSLRETIRSLLQRVKKAIAQAERFAANAAHELRTPLTTLRGELELLSELPGSSEELNRAQKKVAEIELLIERLLILALPERQMASGELISMHELVEDYLAELSAADRKRTSLSPPSEEFLIRGDATLVRTLVGNGVSNALKFGQSATIAMSSDGNQVVVQINDDGPGVAGEDREALFEPFVRSSQARAADIPGHGLGLALIANIARYHGGSARFVAVERGARLEIRLSRSEG